MTRAINIGIGELNVTKAEGYSLKTFALGSCIAIIMLDPAIKAIGMAHIALPDSSIDRVKALTMPGYFADTAIPALLSKMSELGSNGFGRGFIIKLIGGANIMDEANIFNIGKRNLLSCRKILWQFKLPVHAEDTGGDSSRTVEVFRDRGTVRISCPGKENWEL